MVRGPNHQQTFGDSSRSPAVMSPVQETNPAPFGKLDNRSQQPQGIPISTEELQKRQEELERKARELERREEELRNNPYNGNFLVIIIYLRLATT